MTGLSKCYPALLAVLLLALPAIRDGAAQPVTTQWQQQFYGLLGGQSQLLYNDTTQFGKLTFGDLDADGDPDLLLGTEDGTLRHFTNEGSRGRPRFRLRQEHLTALFPGRGGGTQRGRIDVGTHAAPALVDIDGDGDLDLFVGAADGKLAFFRNVGTPVLPTFELVTATFISGQFGEQVVPFFADIDRDRAPDLFIGNFRGEVHLLANQGSKKRAVFCVEFPPRDALPDELPPCTPAPRLIIRMEPDSHASPALADWDQDGDMDLFVGKTNGTIAYLENQGSAFMGRWSLSQPRFLAIDDGGHAAPAFLDAMGRGRPDLVVGSTTSNVPLYTNKDTGRILDVWKVTENFLQIARLGRGRARLVPAFGDLDGDGDADLVLGTGSGELLWWENAGSKERPDWKLRAGQLINGVTRNNMAPILADLDGDGDLDILAGGDDGRLWLFRNTGDPQSPAWQMDTGFFGGIDVGTNSVPLLLDVDGDKLADLLVGNSQGLVIHYRNQGSATAPDFVLTSTRFGGLGVGQDAAPTAFDQDGDGRPDLVVGNREGSLTLVLAKGGNGNAATESAWEVASRIWNGIRTSGNSVPRFMDLDGDSRPDLAVTDVYGNLKLWHNRGRTAAGAAAGPAPTDSAPRPGETGPVADGAAAAPSADAGSLSTLLGADTAQSTSTLFSMGDSEEEPPAAVGETLAPPPESVGPITPVYQLASRQFGELAFSGRSAPTFGDLDGDGDLDLIVGTSSGDLVYLRNDGDAQTPRWTRVTPRVGGFDQGRYPSPLLVDMDGDGRLDLLVGTERGEVLFYRHAPGGNPPLAQSPESLGGVNVGRNAAPALLPRQSGEAPVLVVGALSGQISAYVPAGTAQSLNFKLIDRRFLGIDVGVSATPYVGDMNRDGSPELLIGSDQGLVSYYQRPDGKTWRRGEDHLASQTFPAGTTPRLADIDGDGDLDLILGSEQGGLYLYRNDAVMQGTDVGGS